MLYNICSTCRNRSDSVTHKKSSDFHGGIRFQSSFTIRWELEDKNFVKIDIICLDDSVHVKHRIMAIKTNENFITFSNSLEGRTWLPLLNWYQASIGQSQMFRPRGRFARSKARQGDSLRHQIPAPCPHSPPPTEFTLIGALLWFLFLVGRICPLIQEHFLWPQSFYYGWIRVLIFSEVSCGSE